MIISRTPFRISFFGGGTDYPTWYREHGGAVLGTSIDKYCYLTCRYLPPFFEHRLRVVYSKIEMGQRPEDIAHPVVRAVLQHLDFDRGLELHHDGDLPARSGMGSSSAFTVGLLHALYALRGQMLSKHELATLGIHVEQALLRETVGSQDQVLAAYGGLNHVRFAPSGEISVSPLTVTRARLAELNSHLMLFYSGIARTASDVAARYVGELCSRVREMSSLVRMVDDSIAILAGGGDLTPFGELLHEAWQLKRGLAEGLSSPAIDDLYATARASGAVGGKLVGAGGGGFLLLFVPPAARDQVLRGLADLVHVPFQFESGGSQIIFYDPEEDYSGLDRRRAAR